MHPKNRMERGLALKAIADTAEKLQTKGASDLDVTNFIIGAKQKLAEERPDLDKRADAVAAAARWGKTNID